MKGWQPTSCPAPGLNPLCWWLESIVLTRLVAPSALQLSDSLLVSRQLPQQHTLHCNCRIARAAQPHASTSCCCLQAPICNRFKVRQYPTMWWGLPAHFLAANNSALADFTDHSHRNPEGILKWLSEVNKS